ncbi:hypothetical protein BHY07_04470 [Bacillus subtilis subsp. subtilis]|jgi:hypothetical protein|nr:hypothetical protein I33_0890 [Bacillus subtilis subsp. subtilis str. RO-NN-1]AHA76751.1 Hypothetical Protein U712_04015 [Bacillus subtilis PY79]AIY92082.1 hypothetical protein QU35_04480 [Bacillus subtilis subsp. subtilis str. 168]AIY96394.1 hypothetical protein QX56_04475 [Bacillus subtilis]AJE93461.1 hypothetical protein RP72_04360 [Bacillus subtilis subsp. subtilis]AKC46335.1 hypothetical protein O7A_04475 [Bacillus subtilis KCTC 1028 = ATCC 6051a]AOL28342.1 hypothetical protein BGM23_
MLIVQRFPKAGNLKKAYITLYICPRVIMKVFVKNKNKTSHKKGAISP